ncbi:MAG: hypothetical protein ABW205_12380 [Burkholderiales bacterium]
MEKTKTRIWDPRSPTSAMRSFSRLMNFSSHPVLMFGDWVWVENRNSVQALRQNGWLSSLSRPVIEIGAGTAIPFSPTLQRENHP